MPSSFLSFLSRLHKHWLRHHIKTSLTFTRTLTARKDFRRRKTLSPGTSLFSCSEHLILSLTQIYEGNCWIINEWCKRFTELVINKKNGCEFGQVPCILTSVCMLSILKLNGTTTRLKTSTSICFHYECWNQRLIVHPFLIIFSASINVTIICRLIGKFVVFFMSPKVSINNDIVLKPNFRLERLIRTHSQPFSKWCRTILTVYVFLTDAICGSFWWNLSVCRSFIF